MIVFSIVTTEACKVSKATECSIIRAEGEKAAAENIALAAGRLAKTAGGLHVRTLQTLSELSADKNNTIVFVTPLEILRAFEGLVKKTSK